MSALPRIAQLQALVPTGPYHIVAAVLALLILSAYAASLWWLLRRESSLVLLGLLAVCGFTLALRLLYTTDFPTGLNEDEVKSLYSGKRALDSGDFLDVAIEGPVLLNSLFQASLIPVFGPNRWAIRSYSILASVLAVAVAFAVGRACRLRVASSLGIAGLVAVLPWALFYGRISIGGEMTFHQLLLLAALARLVFAAGGLPEVAIGTLGLTLLLYDYTCGWSMVGMPVLAALLAHRWRRLMCLVIVVVAVLCFAPYVMQNSQAIWREGIHGKVPAALSTNPIALLQSKVLGNFRALVWPKGRDGWLAVRCAAMHPPFVLALASLGALTGVRRGLFLVGGFLGALVPSVLSEGDLPSTHRMLMMYPFIAIAAGCAFDLVRWRSVRVSFVSVAILIAAYQSVTFYFSSAFWLPESTWIFDWERTELVDAIPLPPHPRLILLHDVEPFYEARTLIGSPYERLTVENWFPRNGPALYAFGASGGPLRPFYESLFGYEHVQGFWRAFLVTLDSRDWSWLRQHGWTYEVHCGTQKWSGQVPVLFHPGITLSGVYCPGNAEHVWHARWDGPHQDMELRFTGKAVVDTSAGRVVDKQGSETAADFTLEPGSDVTVRLTIAGDENLRMGLFEVMPDGIRLPAWERATPQ